MENNKKLEQYNSETQFIPWNANITKLSLSVLAQVGLFLLVYLSTIAFGIALAFLAFYASLFVVPFYFETIGLFLLRLGKAGFLLNICCIIAYVGLWVFIAALAVYLIKPLFIFPKKNEKLGREIKRADSPELYDLIESTAKAAGVKSPKHIYVNQEVNACVFFNTSFWNIFLPVRKNLSIGLALFESTNTEEVRSIIAHEFGHFAQNSMRVGSVLYVSNKIISDLVYRRDKLDYWLLRWCLKSGIWGFWGKVTQTVVIWFRNMLEGIYQNQQRSYMKLSRQMEYDADAVSCRIVGSKTFVSALCKIERLNTAFSFYGYVLDDIAKQNQTISDYWEGYSQTRSRMADVDISLTSFDKEETRPDNVNSSSLITVEEIWQSHPSTIKRINHALQLNLQEREKQPAKPSWDIVDDRVKKMISDDVLTGMKEDGKEVTTISWDEYLRVLDDKVKDSVYPGSVDPFFARTIFTDMDGTVETVEDPLSESNKNIIRDYEQALMDKQTLNILKTERLPLKNFMYNGVCYPINEVPLDIHDKYLSGLKAKAKGIDVSIRKLAMSKVEDVKYVDAAYNAIDYVQSLVERIQTELLSKQNKIKNDLGRANIAGPEDYENLRNKLGKYESSFKEVLNTLELKKIMLFMTSSERAYMKHYAGTPNSFSGYIDSDAVDHTFSLIRWVTNIYQNVSRAAKMYIVSVVLDEKPLPPAFLELWVENKEGNTSSKLQNAETEDGRDHVIIESNYYGTLNLPVPTDEEIDTISQEEEFRYRMWEKYDALEKKNDFDLRLVTTVPIKESCDYYTYLNPEDKERFLLEMREIIKFEQDILEDDNWDIISERAKEGDPQANGKMAGLYFGQERYDSAYDAAMKGALGGDINGIMTLGLMEGYGEINTPELAAKLFKCSAVGGDAYALTNLGFNYINGIGVPQDMSRAVVLFERAARQGNSHAENNLGNSYLNGYGVEADPEKGVYWLRKAIDHGDKNSINLLWAYYKSIGDTKQYMDALMYGAEHGVAECNQELRLALQQKQP
jgi:Zn-dependent protease with chaperone function